MRLVKHIKNENYELPWESVLMADGNDISRGYPGRFPFYTYKKRRAKCSFPESIKTEVLACRLYSYSELQLIPIKTLTSA